MPPQTYEATDPKTGQKWTWDGKKWNAETKGAVQRYKEGLRGAMGMDPTGTFSGDISDLVSGGKQIATHPLDSAKMLLDALGESQQEVINKAYLEQHDPHVLTKIKGFIRGGESAIPVLGPLLSAAGDKFSSGDIAGGLGTMTPLVAEPLAERGVPTVKTAATKVVKPAVRDLLGVGKGDVARQIEKTGAKESAAVAKATAKVETAKQAYAEAVQDALKKRAEASAKETAAKTKQEALVSKHGPVYKRLNEMADDAQQHVAKVEQKVHEAETAKWETFGKNIGDPPVSTEPLREALTKAESKLTGETLPVFKKIINEIGEEDVGLKEMLDNMAPEVRERAMAAGVTPSTDVPFSTMRKIYTKLSRSLGAKDIAPEVARATGEVLNVADDTIAKAVTKKGGPEALKTYRNLQGDWRKYRQTFSDRDSPLRKITEAKDPSTKLGPITGETGARAVDYLGRYRNLGAQPEKLGRIRAVHKSLKELPGGGGKAPSIPERPQLPSVPEKRTITPEQARKELLSSKESFYSRPPSRWELMFPPLLAYKMALKHLMQNQRFTRWLAGEGGEGVAVPGGHGIPFGMEPEQGKTKEHITHVHPHSSEEED